MIQYFYLKPLKMLEINNKIEKVFKISGYEQKINNNHKNY